MFHPNRALQVKCVSQEVLRTLLYSFSRTMKFYSCRCHLSAWIQLYCFGQYIQKVYPDPPHLTFQPNTVLQVKRTIVMREWADLLLFNFQNNKVVSMLMSSECMHKNFIVLDIQTLFTYVLPCKGS